MGGYSVYGLGILLTVEDQATNKLLGVNSSLQQLSTTAMSLNYMGKSLIDTGMKMLSPIVGLSKEIIRVGSDAEKTRLTFGALYKDANKGAQKFNEIIDYAAKTPFDIETLEQTALTFKTLGIEIIGEGSNVTDSTGKTRQFIEILGDLGAGLSGVARNGFKDVAYATKEFVTEGNKLSFLRRIGIDIDAVLEKGYKAENTLKQLSLKVGETAEERLKNTADLVNALNMDGLMHELQSSWSTMISNMDDIWYKFCLKLGDSGAFNVFRDGLKSIMELGNALIDDKNSEKFFSNMGKAFKALARPLDLLVSKILDLATAFVKFGADHPNFVKWALLAPVIAGGLFMLAGSALVLKSSLMLLGYGLGLVISMIPKALLLAGIFKVVSYAWEHDIGKIRTRITGFVKNLQKAFGDASKISKQGTDDMIKSYQKLYTEFNRTNDPTTKLTLKLLEFNALWRGTVDFWNNNKLSDDNYKLLNGMGLLPFFEKVATWTNRIKEFCKGIVEGFTDVINFIGNVGKKIGKAFNSIPLLGNGGKRGKGFLGMLGLDEDGKGFKNAGAGIGRLLTIIFSLKLVFGAIGKISGLIKKSASLFGKDGIFGKLRGLFGLSKKGDKVGDILELPKISKPKDTLKAMANLSIILIGLAGLATVIGLIASIPGNLILKGSMAIGAMTIAMIPFATPMFPAMLETLKRLSKFKPATILKGMRNLAIIIGGLTAMVAVVGLVSMIPFNLGRVTALIGLVALLGVIGTALSFLSDIVSIIPASSVALGLANMAIVIGGLAIVVMALGAVSLIPFDLGRISEIATLILKVGLIGSALSVCAGLIGLIPITALLSGLANIAVALAGVSAIIVAFGKLSEIKGFNAFITKGGETLSNLFNQIGKIGGSFVSGVGEGLTKSLPKIGKNISDFAEAIKPAMVIFGKANLKDTGSFFKEMGSFMWNMTKNKIGEAFVGKSDFRELGSQLSDFAKSAFSFFIITSILPDDGFRKAKLLFESLADIGNIPNTGGKLQKIIGEINIEGLAEKMPAFGVGMASFYTSIQNIKDKAFTNATKLFQSLADIGNIPNTGGWAQKFSGENDLSGLAKKMPAFGKAMSQFYTSIQDIKDEAFGKAESLFQSLKGLGKAIPNKGGLAQLFSGKNDISGTGKALGKFGTDIKPFLDNVTACNPDKIKNLWPALGALNSTVFNTSGLAKVGTDLSNFMKNAKSFFTEASGIDVSGVNTVAQSISSFFAVINSTVITSVSTLYGVVSDVVTMMYACGDAVMIFGNNLTAMGDYAQTTAVIILASFSQMSNYTSVFMAQMVLSVLTGSLLVISGITTMTSSCTSALSDFASSGYSYGSSLCSNIASGIADSAWEIRSAIQTAVQNASTSVSIRVPINTLPHAATGIDNFAGGLIQINEKGGEIVELPSGSKVYPHDESVNEAYKDGLAQSKANNSYDQSHNDYSVHFGAGSIVVQVQKATDAEAERVANMVVNKINRKLKKQKLANYTV